MQVDGLGDQHYGSPGVFQLASADLDHIELIYGFLYVAQMPGVLG